MHTVFVVARTGSMKAAAAELGVTAGAISQRMRNIETAIGQRLFERSRKGVRLTNAGCEFLSDVDNAFGILEKVSSKYFNKSSSNHLRINTVASFAATVLAPGLGEFSQLHPEINVSIETDCDLVDLRTEPVDLAIRHGLGEYSGLKSEWLVAPEMIVVASPELINKGSPINSPKDCLAYSLINDHSQKDWGIWFDVYGVDHSNAKYGASYPAAHLVVRAAVKGHGLALVSDIYASEELKNGSLIPVLDMSWPNEFAYYAVGLPEEFSRPAVRKFVRWMKKYVIQSSINKMDR